MTGNDACGRECEMLIASAAPRILRQLDGGFAAPDAQLIHAHVQLMREAYGKPITMRQIMSHSAGFEEGLKYILVPDAKDLPKLGIWQQIYYDRIYKLKSFSPLNMFDYRKEDAKKELISRIGWVDYGGKHFENVFTRFYQGYILPTRFQVDKRKAHLSTLICSEQITRDEAMAELKKPPYDLKLMSEDYEYVSKKLGFTPEEFDKCLTGPIRRHSDFKEEVKLQKFLSRIAKMIKK